MGDDPSDIERRLLTATARRQELRATIDRRGELDRRRDGLRQRIGELRGAHALEERDVQRLEGLSLTRVLAALRGSREDRLARERAEAEAAGYRVAEAVARLEALDREDEQLAARLDRLAPAEAEYTAALAGKERWLATTGDDRAPALAALAEEAGRLADDLREVEEARDAAIAAGAALDRLARVLESASGWSTVDTFLGGGMLASAVKHNRLDSAARLAAQADRALVVLRDELADVPGMRHGDLSARVDGLTQFVDIWFDNIFTDLAVGRRISDSRRNVAACRSRVVNLLTALDRRRERAEARLQAIAVERADLLTR
jgi:hypothetical protein